MSEDRYIAVETTLLEIVSVETYCAVLYSMYLSDSELDLESWWDKDAVITEAKCIWC